jgi:hypothetical protein
MDFFPSSTLSKAAKAVLIFLLFGQVSFRILGIKKTTADSYFFVAYLSHPWRIMGEFLTWIEATATSSNISPTNYSLSFNYQGCMCCFRAPLNEIYICTVYIKYLDHQTC